MDEEREQEREKVRHAARIKRLKFRLVAGGVALLLISLLLGIVGLVGMIRISGRLKETQALLLQVSAQMASIQTEEAADVPAEASAEGAEGATTADPELASADGEKIEVSQDIALNGGQAQTLDRDPYSDKVKVYLTFDDGPSCYTDEILNILNTYGVKATFFVNGREGYDEQYRRIVAEGHTLGMHSYSHKYAEIYEDLDSFAEDLYRIQDFLEDKTGESSVYYRFPGGSSNTVSRVEMTRLIEYLNAKGIVYYDWNVACGDASGGYHSAESLASSVITQINALNASTVVVLMHDAADKASTVEALPLIIERIQAMDNTVILPITENTVPVQHVSLSDTD